MGVGVQLVVSCVFLAAGEALRRANNYMKSSGGNYTAGAARAWWAYAAVGLFGATTALVRAL